MNSVISDRKIQTATAGIYLADIKSYTDYYPFGYRMPGRIWIQDDYRYSFNGQEKDNEIYGGNFINFEFRGYDGRLGRFWSVDPLIHKYSGLSSYSFVANNPILQIDKKGREIWIYSSNKGEKPILYQPGMEEIGNNFQQQAIAALNYISSSGSDVYDIVNTLAGDKTNIRINEESNWITRGSSTSFKTRKDAPISGTIPWSPIQGIVTNEDGRQSAAATLLHELGHFYFQEHDPMNIGMPDINNLNAFDAWADKWKKYAKSKGYDNIEDYWIIEFPENKYAIKEGEGTRKEHSYKDVFKAKDFKSLEGPTATELDQ